MAADDPRARGVVDSPDWWVGAGVIRDVVWDACFGTGIGERTVKDVDVVFIDPDDLSPTRDTACAYDCDQRDQTVVWDANHQAAVHIWYPMQFGIDVPPLRSVPDAVATRVPGTRCAWRSDCPL